MRLFGDGSPQKSKEALRSSRVASCLREAQRRPRLAGPLYDWCTEGVDTADLQEAKALLEALGA